MWKPQRNPETHVGPGEETLGFRLNQDEDLVPCSDCKEILRGPSQLAWRLDLPEAPRAGP